MAADSFRVVAATIGGTLIIAVLVILVTSSGGRLSESDTAFSVPTLVGQPAPSFTATNVDGQPLTVTPGDGRAKVLVFYMGFR